MATKAVLRTRDNLVAALMKLETKRDDLFEQHVWARFSHFMTVYHMEQNVARIARNMPAELRDREAA